jgi:hypothetical protein
LSVIFCKKLKISVFIWRQEQERRWEPTRGNKQAYSWLSPWCEPILFDHARRYLNSSSVPMT